MATKKNEKQRWVYEALVQSDQDVIGLVAYGLYKSNKADMCRALRVDGAAEDVIRERARAFHDTVITGEKQIAAYRARAESFVDEVLRKETAPLEEEIKGLKEKKTQQDSKMKDKAVLDFSKKVNATLYEKRPAIGKFLLWLASGIPAALASVAIAALAFLAPFAFKSDQERGQAAADMVNRINGKDLVQPVVQEAPQGQLSGKKKSGLER